MNLDELPPALQNVMERYAAAAVLRAQQVPFPADVRDRFHQGVNTIEESFVGLIPIIQKFCIISAITTVMIITSCISYGFFYLLIMPPNHATEILYFDYSGLSNHPAPNIAMKAPVMVGQEEKEQAHHSNNNNDICTSDSVSNILSSTTTKNLNADNDDGNDNNNILFSAPWATVDLFAKHNQWEAYRSDVVPRLVVKDHKQNLLVPKQPYFMEVVLELPESFMNQRNGMFMVQVELQSSSGTKLATSLRPARLPHESHWIGVVRRFVWLIPLLVGAVQESRTIIIPSFRHFVESKKEPLRYVTVRLIARNSLPSNDNNDNNNSNNKDTVEVIAGDLRIGKELNAFQTILKEWFYTSFMVGTLILFTAQLCLLVALRLGWYVMQARNQFQQRQQQQQQQQRQHYEEDEEPPCDLDPNQELPSEGIYTQGGQYNDEGLWEDIPPGPSATTNNNASASTTAPPHRSSSSSAAAGGGAARQLSPPGQGVTVVPPEEQDNVDTSRTPPFTTHNNVASTK